MMGSPPGERILPMIGICTTPVSHGQENRTMDGGFLNGSGGGCGS
jgi:hypothetical protein